MTRSRWTCLQPIWRGQRLAEAKRALKDPSAAPHCVVCDHTLGQHTGLGLLQDIRSGQLAGVDRGLPFVLLTAHGDEQIIRGALELDLTAYLMKPVSQTQFLETIEGALGETAELRDAATYKAVNL